jgi:hypothetical protein
MEFFRICKAALSLFFIFIFSSAHSQRCNTYEYYKKYAVSNSIFNGRVTDVSTPTRDTLLNEVITIPVVIHVLYNNADQNISDAQILSQLQSLNNDYRKLNADAANVPAAFAPFVADAKIVFCIAKIDASGKPTTGIIRKYTSQQSWTADDGVKYSAQGGDNAWDSKRYLNIWVCNLFGRNLGYSSLPGSQVDKDGVVIQYDAFGTTGNVTAPFNKGRTATHEIGHWLGLKHIWGDATCGDDGISDTPQQQNFNSGCPSFPHKSTCSINSNGDMFMNFTDDACMYMFTHGQAIKMRSQFAIGGARNSFLNSSVCDSNSVQRGATVIDPVVTKITISIFPNPATKYINLETKSATDLIGETIKICNVYGGVVKSQILMAQKTTIAIDNLSAGIYFIKLGDGKENKTLRFVKE